MILLCYFCCHSCLSGAVYRIDVVLRTQRHHFALADRAAFFILRRIERVNLLFSTAVFEGLGTTSTPLVLSRVPLSVVYLRTPVGLQVFSKN